MVNGASSNLSAGIVPDRFEDAHRRLLDDGSIQFELRAFEPPQMPSWLRWLAEFLEGGGPIFKAIFWGLVVVGVLLLLYALARWLDGRGHLWRPRTEETAEPSWQPEEAPARALLQQADALAAAGNYSEAAHLLLHRSIEDIDARRPQLVRPALTSRDIADAPALPQGPKAAFSRIVLFVERSLFGGRALDAGDWAACRGAYEEFAFAPEWGR